MGNKAWLVAFVAFVLGMLIGSGWGLFVSEQFEQNRCVALEERLGDVNLAWSSRGCVLAEDL